MKRKMFKRLIPLFFVGLFFSCAYSQEIDKNNFDIAVLNGRIIDPELGTMDAGNLGIKEGKIAIITKDAISGKNVIDANGLVISPGFIDFLSYDLNGYGEYFKIADGVTTNLSMHGSSTVNFKSIFEKNKKTAAVNYGGAVNQVNLRYSVGLMGAYDKPTKAQVDSMAKLARKAIEDGALGISFSFEYIPGTTDEEALSLFKLAKEYNVLCTIHIRYATMYDKKTNIDAINEIISLCERTGASAQIVHINSTGGTFSMKQSLEMIENARQKGLDLSIDMYPYDSWATYLASSRFDGDWQKRFNISYDGLQIGGSQERLTEATFKKYKKENKLVVAYAIPEDDVVLGLKSPLTMIGSDTMIQLSKNNHPRGAGCFSRLFGKYVREEKVLSLVEAVKKVTLMPAQRLEKISSDMLKKGRMQTGADADIVIFNPDTIADKSTVENPAQYSAGIEYVIVNGVVVKDKDGVKKNIFPGKPIKRNNGK